MWKLTFTDNLCTSHMKSNCSFKDNMYFIYYLLYLNVIGLAAGYLYQRLTWRLAICRMNLILIGMYPPFTPNLNSILYHYVLL
jgi:hypothetical protein